MKIRPRDLRRPAAALLTVLVALVGLLPVNATEAAQRPAGGELPTIHIRAHDYHYDLSRRSLPPGPVNVAFTNHGPRTHALQTARIDPGRTQAEFVKVLQGFLDGTITESPSWLHLDVPFAFGPTSPGRSVAAAVRLSQPGRYVVFDLLTGRSGRTFAERGMVASFSVAGNPRAGSLPRADAVITGTDTAFQVPPLRAGRLVLKLRNEAKVERQFAIIQLQHGRTIGDLRAWILDGQVGPAPGEFVANVLPIAVGARLLLKLRLTPGHYVLVDNGETEDGVPYSQLGLLTRFVVGSPRAPAVQGPRGHFVPIPG